VGAVSLCAGGVLPAPLPALAMRALAAACALVFLARALAPSKYVGLFKRVRGTRFARFDTAFYCPLCLALGAGLATLAAAG
jgi:hypothetical protein